VQDHGVGDVGNVKFVKANELVALGNARAQHVQRVLRALQGRQLAVDFAHKFVKVQAHFALERHGVEKAVHEKAFAAPHRRTCTRHAECQGGSGAFSVRWSGAFCKPPILRAALQGGNGAHLRRVAGKPFGSEFRLIGLLDVHGLLLLKQ